MKKVLISAVILLSMPAFAAKVKDAKCSEMDKISDKVTPEYLAVIDGYDKAGKKVDEEIDMGGIVTEAKKVKEECGNKKTAKIEAVRNDVKKTQANAASPSTTTTTTNTPMNPTKAKCQEFVDLGEEVQPVAVFWVAGHDKSGKLRSGEVEEEYLERPIATLVQDCKAKPTASFYQEAKSWLKRKM